MFVLLIDHSHSLIITFEQLYFELALLTAKHTTAEHPRTNTLVFECYGVVLEYQPVVAIALMICPLLSFDCDLLSILQWFCVWFAFALTHAYIFYCCQLI